ncbi:amino acid ABC transporter permease [Agromyces atrinae]|uniref:Amino acid ABC transporter permease n=1 Tax=Agromyces atrinae TaxID=592376 RepID=A0A4Q2M5F0_9MICO|nr:amino acid ABC transporter permease [Agromyces atrinae]MCI2958348.1 amino acid ABC transporter permease [Agromyces atrinae]NYD66438.1 glutamate transport system permease protein [Agromyces atrinae]RXZ87118.1 amino acid ABC transporter permease [Agromyces atrinae]
MSGSSVLFDAPGPRARALSRTFSIVAGVLIVAGLVWIYFTLAAPRPASGGMVLPGMFDATRWDIFADPVVWRFIGEGAVATLQAAAVAAVGAVALGIVFSILRSAETKWISIPIAVVLEFFRGMPVLLMMLFILLVGSTGAFWAVVIALIVYNGALIGESLRAGLASLPRGQREAGLSLGMRPLQSKMLVEFPQAFRQMLPIIVAQLVVLLKDTSLGYIVGYDELLRRTINNLGSFYGNRYLFSLFVVATLIYLAMNLALSFFARWLSKRTASGGRKARRGGRGSGPVGGPEELDPSLATLKLQAYGTDK